MERGADEAQLDAALNPAPLEEASELNTLLEEGGLHTLPPDVLAHVLRCVPTARPTPFSSTREWLAAELAGYDDDRGLRDLLGTPGGARP